MLKQLHAFLILFAIQLSPSHCLADESDIAYQYFVQGKDAFEGGDLNKAKRLLEQARTLRTNDGKLLINKTAKFGLINNSRGIESKQYVDGDTVHYTPNKLLKSITKLVSERRERRRLIAKSGNKPALVIKSSLSDSDSDGYHQALESLSLHVLLTNQGESTAEDVIIRIKNDHDLDNVKTTWHVGDIAAKSELEKVINFTLSEDFNDNELEVMITADERDGYAATPLVSTFPIIPWEKPDLRVSSSNNLPLETGRATPLVFTLTNNGKYPVKGIQINAEFSVPGLSVVEQQWPEQYKSLTPGATRELNLIVKANSDFNPSLSPKIQFFTSYRGLQENAQSPHNIASFSTRVASSSVRYQVGSNHLSSLPVPSTQEIKDGYPPALLKNPIMQKNSYALIIGNRDYNNINLPVPYAINDANLMKNVFTKTIGIPEENIIQHSNATLADLRTTLGSQGEVGRLHLLLNHSQKQAPKTLFVYYSGHGVPAKNRNWSAYLMPSDATPDYIEHSGYALDQLYEQLSLTNAEQIVVFLDACFSGEQQNGLMFPNTSPGTLRLVKLPQTTGDKRIKVISAAGSDDMGLWLDQASQGLFTTYLARGLSGLADQGDKKLTLRELYDYVYASVTSASARMARSQTPNAQGNLDEQIIKYGY